MNISIERLDAEAEKTGFRREMLEKVFHLLNLLEGFQRHPFIKDRLVLKGGTALNLFVFDVPRLSVDIDVNYIGAVELEKMNEERPKVEKAIEAVCSREGMRVKRRPDDHAGGKWQFAYDSALGGQGNIEVDLNYMYRTPLWPAEVSDSKKVGQYEARGILVLDIHELAAGKLAALFSRHASRDLFDVHRLLVESRLDDNKLRLGFVVYGAMSRTDWRQVSINDIAFEPRELEAQLVPVLRSGVRSNIEDIGEWGENMMTECRKQLRRVLPMYYTELEFLNRLLDYGEIKPAILTHEERMIKLIETHPAIQWKALNARKHRKK